MLKIGKLLTHLFTHLFIRLFTHPFIYIEKINSACSLKTKFSCVYNPIIEDWPGFGVWKSSDDKTVEAAAEECGQEYGPDQVYAFPGNFFTSYLIIHSLINLLTY